MPADNLGYARIWRELFSNEWEFYGDTNTTFLFITLFVLANYKDGHWKGNKIKRSQLITSYTSLSKKTGLSIQQIRTSLGKLKSTDKITHKTTNKFSLITVNNYDKYQKDNKQNNKQITNKQQTNNKQITTNNKNKKNKKNKKETQSSKNGLYSCTDDELKYIAELKKISLDSVKRKHELIIDKINDGIFQKKDYGKTVYYTLQAWLQKDIENDKLKQVKKYSDELVEAGWMSKEEAEQYEKAKQKIREEQGTTKVKK